MPDGPMLGGAPLNLAVHVGQLGRPSAILTAVGIDDLGQRTRLAVEERGVDVAWIQTSPTLPTGTSQVALDGIAPTFAISSPAAYDDLSLDNKTLQEIVRASPAAIAMGTLAQQGPLVRATTIRVLNACPDAVRFYDANLRDGWDATIVDDLLRVATVIKLNEGEAIEVAQFRGLSAQDPRAFTHELADQTGARAVCVTRGAESAALLLDGRFVEGRPPAVAPTDTVGAGDAFSAALLDGILGWQEPEWILRRALALGALVASRAGGTPIWEEEELEDILGATPIPT